MSKNVVGSRNQYIGPNETPEDEFEEDLENCSLEEEIDHKWLKLITTEEQYCRVVDGHKDYFIVNEVGLRMWSVNVETESGDNWTLGYAKYRDELLRLLVMVVPGLRYRAELQDVLKRLSVMPPI